jgi:hypothetical protein
MGSYQEVSLETVVALAVGIPAMLIALITLWIGYLSFRDSHKHLRTKDLEFHVVLPSTRCSTQLRIPATDDFELGMPVRPSLAKLRSYESSRPMF